MYLIYLLIKIENLPVRDFSHFLGYTFLYLLLTVVVFSLDVPIPDTQTFFSLYNNLLQKIWIYCYSLFSMSQRRYFRTDRFAKVSIINTVMVPASLSFSLQIKTTLRVLAIKKLP